MISNNVLSKSWLSGYTPSAQQTRPPALDEAPLPSEQPVRTGNASKSVSATLVSAGNGPTSTNAKTEQLINAYRSRVAEDMYFIKQAVKEKMAEYNLSPDVALSLKMNAAGKIEVKGSLNNPILAMIETDLNSNVEMKRTLADHKKNSFMVKYIHQARMLQNAYGQANRVVDRLQLPVSKTQFG
jgi:hypothetical protein